MRSTDNRTVVQALVVFLCKLRTVNSNKLTASILELNEEQLVSEYCKQVMHAFEKDVLPTHFGFSGLSRQELISFIQISCFLVTFRAFCAW